MNLVFVYNADSGLFNALTDIAHKLFSPDTYQCNLCQLTHGHFTAREEWMNFLRGLDSDITFLHRDEYVKLYGKSDIDLSAIFVKDDATEQLKLWIDKTVINNIKTTDELMEMIRAALLRHQSGASDMDDFLSLPV